MALLALLALPARAQILETGAEVQGWNYQGDLVPYRAPHLPVTRPGLGLFVRANPHNNLSVKLAYAHGSVEGSDKNFKERAIRNNPLLAFRTDLTFLSLHGEFHFLGRERRSIRVYDSLGNRVAFPDIMPDGSVTYRNARGRELPYKLLLWRQASPYISLGLGALFFDPRIVRTDPIDKPLAPPLDQKELTRDYARTAFSMPIGAGCKFYLSEHLTLHVEASLLSMGTDYIDGISISRDPGHNDWLSMASVGISYRWGRLDRDGDGIPDREDRCPDLKGDIAQRGCPDQDGDGIPDIDDRCPTEAGPQSAKGCPDRDGDGVPDKRDKCPDHPGSVLLEGCADQDGDGVSDAEDECPDIVGKSRTKGCPDRDDDGVPDKDDRCPDVVGVAALKGCPDSDRDGVPDVEDRCPQASGPRDLQGCPDLDRDQVADIDDRCPNQPGSRTNGGCPEAAAEELVFLERIQQEVSFEAGKATLLPVSLPLLDSLADILSRLPHYDIRIEGHTDSLGTEAERLTLTKDRAQACRDRLVKRGIAPSRIRTEGMGDTMPIAPHDTPEGRSLNRRIVFVLFLD